MSSSRKGGGGGARQCTVLSGVLSLCFAPVVVLLCIIIYKFEQINLDSSDPGSAAKVLTWDESNPLSIPRGQAPNLPSLRRADDDTSNSKRQMYGGKGDKEHLGGFTTYDRHGISPRVWTNMITKLGVKSLMDVGCGRGISTLWFHLQGVETLCVEGSHDAVEHSVLPNPQGMVVEHDFSRGPWWPGKTYDAVWSVEFLEHVGVNHHFNYISTFRKAAILFVTSSRWGGWHHVEVHQDDWWIRKYTSYGFVFDAGLTEMVRKWTDEERLDKSVPLAPDGKGYLAQHIGLSMKVFINPVVASLPQHAHLFFEHGCYQSRGVTRPCFSKQGHGSESALPKSFLPLEIDPTAQRTWEDIVKKHIIVPPAEHVSLARS